MMPEFRTAEARLAWQRYFARVEQLLAQAGSGAADLGADLQAHIAESYAQQDSAQSESDRLRAALARLGEPEEYLLPLLADTALERATRTYSPRALVHGLGLSLRAGSRRAVIAFGFALGYLLLAIFVVMAVTKPFWGDHVGLFRGDDGSYTFGILASPQSGRELLGLWIIPIAIGIATLLYAGMTRALRVLRRDHSARPSIRSTR